MAPALHRLPFVALGMVALLGGAYAGALRLGWGEALPRPTFVAEHGGLMICGFLGTLIGIERAVALGRSWAYLGPGLTAFTALALLLGLPEAAPRIAALAGGASLFAVSVLIFRRQPEPFNAVMAGGALCWLVGNGLWLAERPPFESAPWWVAFLVLTIGGERLELSRLVRRGPEALWLFGGLLATLAAGLLAGGLTSPLGARLFGAALVGLALWLARYDIARRTVRSVGLPRFTAVCMISGYAWLALAGTILLTHGPAASGAPYDAVLHAILLGFVLAMIFGHAPIIFPAVLGVEIPYRDAFYLHWAVLQASLAARIAGDLTEQWRLREWAGLFNVAAVLLFLLNTALAVRFGIVRGRALARAAATSQETGT